MRKGIYEKYPLSTPIERVTDLELLIRIYIKRNKTDEALILLKELKETSALINTLPLKAAALSAEGIYDYAIKNYKTAKHCLEDAIDLYDKVILPFEASRTQSGACRSFNESAPIFASGIRTEYCHKCV